MFSKGWEIDDDNKDDSLQTGWRHFILVINSDHRIIATYISNIESFSHFEKLFTIFIKVLFEIDSIFRKIDIFKYW